MKIKRLMAGGLSALLAGTTLLVAGGFANPGLGDYVTTSGSQLTSPMIVVGSDAQVSDVIGAADIGVAIAGYATTAGACTSTSTVGVSGGADVASSSKFLYFGSELNRAKSTLTISDLPTILAQGTATVDWSGGPYTYDHYIELGTRTTTFGTSGGDYDDPVSHVDIGSSFSTPLYNLTIVFNKVLNLSHADVQGGEMTLFGVDYTIGTSSRSSATATVNKLELLGGSGSTTVDEGETAEVSVGGVMHDITVDLVEGATTGRITVDGKGKSVTEGVTYTISGDQGSIDVYVKDVMYTAKESGISKMEVVLGSSKVTLQDSQKVKVGTSNTNIDGTYVDIIGDDSGVSKIVISVAAADSTNDDIKAGSYFTDPIFGSFKVAYNGLNPALDSADRDTITIDNSGTTGATLSMTDYRGNEKLMTFAFTATGTWQVDLNASSTRTYVIAEGQPVRENDYVILAPEQRSDFGHLFQLSSISSLGSTTATLSLTDVFSGDVKTVNMATPDYYNATFYIDGQTYNTRNLTAGNEMVFTWGTGAGLGVLNIDAGSKFTIWPTIRGKNGEYVALVDRVILDNTSAYTPWITDTWVEMDTQTKYVFNFTADGANVTLELPTGDLNLSWWNNTVANTSRLYANGVNQSVAEGMAYLNVTVGLLDYNITSESGGCTGYVNLRAIQLPEKYIEGTDNPTGIAVLVLEELDNTTTDRGAIVIGVNADSNSYAALDTPQFTNGYDSATQTTDASITEYVTVPYGTYLKYDSDNQGVITIKYPNEQAISTVAFGADPSFSTTSTGGAYEAVVKIDQPVAKFDTEVSTSTLTSDLILIGGPCVNDLVKTLMADDGITCDNFYNTYKTGVIKEYTNAFESGQTALVVAGWTAADTRNLAAKVMKGTLDYSA